MKKLLLPLILAGSLAAPVEAAPAEFKKEIQTEQIQRAKLPVLAQASSQNEPKQSEDEEGSDLGTILILFVLCVVLTGLWLLYLPSSMAWSKGNKGQGVALFLVNTVSQILWFILPGTPVLVWLVTMVVAGTTPGQRIIQKEIVYVNKGAAE